MSTAAVPPGPPARAARRVAWAGAALVVAYAGFAATQILVLNPLAASPGTSLAQIYADVAGDQSVDALFTVATLALGPILASLLLVLVLREPRLPASLVAVTYLGLLGAGAPAFVLASFGIGVALADTYGIGGDLTSGWTLVLYAGSALAVVAAAVIAVVGTVRLARTAPGPGLPAH